MIKKLLMMFVATMAAIGAWAATYTAEINGSTWSYTLSVSSDKTTTNATITAVTPADGALVVPPAVDGYPVVAIGNNVGKSNNSIKSVRIPNSVQTIGSGAFTWCTSLGEVVLGDGLTAIYGHSETWTDTDSSNSYEQYGAFAGCVSLTNVVFGASLRTIGHQCFTRSSLSHLKLPDSVETIGVQCFFNATSLREVSIGTGLKSMGAHAFAKCTALTTVEFRPCDTPKLAISESAFRECAKLENVNLSQAITSIGLHAFKSCSALKRIDIPDSVTEISGGAFTYCTSLGELILGDGLTGIGGYRGSDVDTDSNNSYEQYGAFAGCVNLTNIVFGSSLETIGNQCFARCTSLPSLSLPDTVTSLGNQCFYGSENLCSVSIGTGLESMGEYAFAKCTALKSVEFRPCDTAKLIISEGAFRWCSELEEVAFSDAIKSFRPDAFNSCSALKRVVIPDSVTGISGGAFTYCTSLGELILGDGLTGIGGYRGSDVDTDSNNSYEQYGAFAGCVNLTNIVFGSSLETIGNQCFARCTSLPSLSLPDTVTSLGNQCFYGSENLCSVSIGTGLESMGQYAFAKCTALKSVEFRPCDMGKLIISEGAFRWCSALEEVAFSDAIKSFRPDAFNSCSALKRVVIPDSVTGISGGAFTYCTSLGELILGDGLTGIGGYSGSYVDTDSNNSYEQYGAFAGCVNLTNIVFGSSLETIGNQCFARCTSLPSLSLPDTVTSLGNQCFYGSENLCSVSIGTGLESMGQYAFAKCTALKRVEFRPCDTGKLIISEGAFRWCSALEEVAFSDAIKSFRPDAFNSCSALKRVVIPDSVTGISGGAFTYCTSLGELILGDGLTGIGGYSGSYVDTDSNNSYEQYGAFAGCVNLTNIVFGSSLETIGNQCFARCSVGNLVFPDTLTSIGVQCFWKCSSLKSVVLGNGLTSVGKYAFANCSALRSLNVGTSMGTFGDYAFSGCENLRYIYFHGLKPPTLGNYVFNKAPTAMIVYVADGGIGWGETNGVLPETWNSWTIKWGSEYTPDADAPYDLMFAETSELDSSFILCDSSEGRVAQHEFLKGNTIYARYAFRDAWADENITKPFTNHFSLGWNGGVQESLGVYVDEIPFYQIGSTALSSFRLRDLDVGSYRLLCILDSENIVAETDEDNNRQTYVFSVIPSTDVKFISEGNELANIKYATGRAYGKLFVPEKRIGFEFNGWYSDEYLTKQITETNTVPDSATTLYAQWDIRPLQTNYVSGTISSDSIWQAGDLYVIENNLTVAKNVKLTIEPGVIIKFKSGKSLTVNAGGTLSAVGTRVHPIVFTSFKDDTKGGDTNKDGDVTEPIGGDWYGISISGNADIAYATMMYAGPSNESGIIEIRNSGELNMDSCTVAHSKYDGIWNWGGSISVKNSIITDTGWATAPYRGVKNEFINCVFYENNVGMCYWPGWSGKPTYKNCIFVNCLRGWCELGSNKYGDPPTTVKVSNSLFYNSSEMGLQSCAKVGKNGNIWGDPKFVNPENGDFRIMGNSPCVDAGDGTIAPEKDYYGTPRMNVDGVRPTGVASVNGAVPDIGIYEVPGSGDIPSADLTVTQVTAPDEMTVGESVEIQWTVKNVGEETASGIWRDEIELVAANGQVLSMGTISTQADIKPGASANFRSTVTVPPAPEGAVQIRLTANKYQDVFECLKVENNAYSVSASLSVSTLNVPVDGNETVISIGSGSENGFAVNVPGGASAVLVIRGEGELKAWLGSGALSSSDTAIRTAVQVGDGLWLLQIPAGTDARVTLSNEGQEAVDIGLSMEVGDFFIFDTGLTAAIVNGASITLTGNGFDESMVCEIVQNGNVVATATDVIVSDSVQATAVFNLATLAAGDYTLRVTKGDDSASANLSLAYSKTGSKWNCDVEMPESVRADRVYVGTLVYSNSGDAPMPAPYVSIVANRNTLIRLSESDAWSDSIEVLACSEVYPASVLKPGEMRRVPFYFKTTGTSASVRLAYTRFSAEMFPWDNIDDMRPSNISDDIWGHAVSVLKARFGNTWNDYLDRLRDDCDMMLKNGQPNIRVDRVWQLEMSAAFGDDYAVRTLASSTDLVRNGRGLSLTFVRVYQSALKSRMKNGVLGYGWDHNYSVYARLEDDKTLIFHLPSGSSYSFTKVSGSWMPQDARDKTILTETSKSYILTFSSGTVYEFAKSNMRTSSIRDNQGNELIFTYSGENLIKVSHSDGQYLSFSYSSGKLVSVRDDQGRAVSYTYDGDLLASAKASDGLIIRYSYCSLPIVLKTYTYKFVGLKGNTTVIKRLRSEANYILGSQIGECNSLSEIIYPDGSIRKFEYDESARVSSMSVNGMQKTEIDRDSLVSYSIKSPNGAVTKVICAPSGEVLKSINALGETVSQVYTADSLLESVIAPSGKRNKITYNKDGQPISSSSASGTITSFAYTDEFANLASVTDAKGHSIGYSYDELGRGTGVRFVDGSSSKLECNERGDVIRSINRRGETIEYEYDSEGNLTKKLWSNGRTFTISYDAKGNITNAADSVTGAVTMEYDANERLTRIVHPKGRGFAFKYDSVGRMIERASFDGAKECFSYDSFGRVKKVADGAGNAYLINTYDSATGWLVTQEYGNGTVVSNAYDILGRTVGIYHLKGKNRIAFFEYTYDVDGKCISQITAEGKESYTYDADGQLTSVTYPDGTSETFTYDAVGNRISRTDGSPVQNESYTVNNLNQYTEIANAQAARSTMEYDLDGNMTRKGDTRYTYDTLNRLVAVTNEAENIRWSCEYDVFGNRVFVTDNGTTTERLFVQGSLPSVAAEYDGEGAVATQHILVGAVRLATHNSPTHNSQTLYYHADLLGSARLITDGTGATKGTCSFKAFGETRKSDGETTNAGYVGTLGVETDSNGLIFMRNRYYDAGMGRFVQMDPIGLNGRDVNMHRYVMNAPMTFIDPQGMSWDTFCNDMKDIGKGMVGGLIAFTPGALATYAYGAVGGAVVSTLYGLGRIGISGSWKRDGGQGAIATAMLGVASVTSIPDINGWGIEDGWDVSMLEFDNEVYGVMFEPEHDEYETIYRDVVISWDPNEITGPAGKGENRYVEQGEWMNYTIYFENKTNATAAAQEVFVDLPMDPNLDWSTLELGEIVFGEHIDTSLSGKSHGKASYAMPGTNTFVKTTVTMKDGVLSWYLRDWDPTTVDNFPASATGGFLPPNNPDTHCGEGHLSYRVRVKSDAPNGAVIRASAQIVFDSNPMIETDPAWWNTVGKDTAFVMFESINEIAAEGEGVTISVAGGADASASSVQLYGVYNTAAAADLDLTKTLLDGKPVKGFKFPYTLSWAAGEYTNRTVTLFTKADKAVEGDEFLTLQLANPVGINIGENDICTMTIEDTNTYATLQDGIMNPNIKVSTKGDGKWTVGEGSNSDESGVLGMYHAESPSLAQGKSSTLSFATVKGNGEFNFYVRFVGDPNEMIPSELSVYNGKKLIGTIDHTQVTNVWEGYTITVSGGSASAPNTYNFVFTQGSDPNTHVEISDISWDNGSVVPVYNVIAWEDGTEGGYVSGSGPYLKGQTAKLIAKPLPGWVFDGWYEVSLNEEKDDLEYALFSKKTTVSFKPTRDIFFMAFFKKIPYIRGLADPADGGKVTGSGLCAAGKKVTLKASANKNFSFVGWYASLADNPNAIDETKCVATTASLVIDRTAKPTANSKTSTTITGIDGDVTYYAVFKGDPRVTVSVDPAPEAGKVTGVGRYAPGKKVTLKATANKGYVFNGWYYSGTAGSAVEENAQAARSTMGEELLTQAASYSFTMPEEDVALCAKFITTEEDAASIALSVDALGGEISPEAIISVTNTCGVALKWSVAADALSQPTVAVSGLPAGLKFTAKDIMKKGSKTEVEIPANTIYGAPTAESKLDAKTGLRKPSAVKFTVTTAGKSKRVYLVDMTVLPLPDWAVGTFNGGGDLGQVSLTVAKTGKLSGKYLSEGFTWSLAADSFDSIDESGDVYRATLIGKSGKLVMTNEIGVACDLMGGFVESIDYIAYQNNWKLEPWKSVGKPFAKAAALEYKDSASVAGVSVPGVLSLKFAASGAVTVKGSFITGINEKTGKEILYSASGTAVLAPQREPDANGAFDAVVFVYLPPKAGKFDGYVRCIGVRWTGEGWIKQ